MDSNAYSLLLDQDHPVSVNPDLMDHFRAHLIHTFLMNERMFITDTQLTRSRNFLTLVANEPGLVDYFHNGCVTIAKRDTGNTSLVGIYNRPFELDINVDKFNPKLKRALQALDRHCDHTTWSYKKVSNLFAHRTKRAFVSGIYAKKFGPSRGIILTEILDQIDSDRRDSEEYAEYEGGNDTTLLGRDVFKSLLYDYMSKASMPLLQGERELITSFADAVYCTNMPALLGLAPIHDSKQSTAFRLLGQPTDAAESILRPFRIKTTLQASSYVQGLNSLSARDVDDLRNTDECYAFRAAKRDFAGTQSDCETLRDSVTAYLRRIDSKILEKSGHLRTSSHDGAEREIQFARYESQNKSRGLIKSIGKMGAKAAIDTGISEGIGMAVKLVTRYDIVTSYATSVVMMLGQKAASKFKSQIEIKGEAKKITPDEHVTTKHRSAMKEYKEELETSGAGQQIRPEYIFDPDSELSYTRTKLDI